jgi:hypothetical protein
MKSRILLISTSLLCISCLLLCCKKDSKTVEESPFYEFFEDAGIKVDTIAQAADTWEYGFAFTPLENGKVTALGIKLPAVGSFEAILWDISGPSPVALSTRNITTTVAHQDAIIQIAQGIALTKGVKYGITVSSNNFYRVTKTGNEKFVFPRTVDNIRIESFNEAVNNSSIATFPTTTNDTRVNPCVNVIFIAD